MMRARTSSVEEVVVSKGKHLSLLHAMLASIEVQTNAKRINEIVNHPSVLPWVGFADKGKLDLTEAIASPDVICLLGAYGGVLFNRMQPDLWEAHSQCLPQGRGQWMLAAVQAALHWMFTRTDAVEIMTRCPEGFLAAKALARAIHGKYEFTNQAGWVLNGRPIPADIYALRLQDWLRKAPGLVERGQWFHDRLDAEMKRLGLPHPKHADDAEHDRQVGLACEMVMGGQPSKACVFYNRWALMAGYAPMALVSAEPLVMDIQTAQLRMVGESFEAMPSQAIH